MITAASIFSAIVAAIQAIPIINSWFEQLIAAWMASQTTSTLTKISDAADAGASAKTDADRYAASQKWITALSSSRMLP